MSKANKTNKLMDFLNVELPDIKKSYCNLTRANRFTASVGYIYPTLVEEILPSDRVKMNIKTILKSNPTVNSVYGSMRQSHQAYFVPLRFYVRELDQNTTFNNNSFTPVLPDSYPDFPVLDVAAIAAHRGYPLFCAPGSLLDMLEILPSGFNTQASYDFELEEGLPPLNAVPLIAYYDIVRNYYFNSQELSMPFVQVEYFTPYDIFDGEQSYVSKVYALTSNVTKEQLDSIVSNAYNGDYTPGGDLLYDAFSENSIPLLSRAPFEAEDRSDSLDARQSCDVHLGYAVRCFDDDYFTTALSNAYVTALDNSVRVNVTSLGGKNGFAVTQLQRARQMARHVSKNILGGTNYDDFIYVHFNTKLGRELNKPYFLGSASSDFWFDDIYASTVGDNQSLGSRAGVLDNSMTYNDFVDFTASEYGYLIVVSSIIPRISYYAGIPKKYLKTNMADLYSPEFDAWGFQGIPQIEVSAIADTPWTFSNGEEYGEPLAIDPIIDFNPSDGGLSVVRKQPAWFEHMASYDRFHGLFTTNMEHSFSIIAKDYSPQGTGSSGINGLMSTYIHPWEFQYLFKYQPSWYDNFTWQILFDLNVYRPISKQILPSY